MGKQHDFQAISNRESGLKKNLSSSQITMIAIGGAIGTGLFLGSGFAISQAGPSVIISYTIGALIAFLLMGCLSEMTVAHPTSGSFGAYAEHYISPLAGYIVRFTYWSCIVAAVGVEVTAVAVYMEYWFPNIPGSVWILVFSAILIYVNATSVNLFGAVEYWFSMIKIVAIVGFIVAGSFIVFGGSSPEIGFQNYTNDGGFFPKGISGTWIAVVIALFSYLSIEMIAVTAGEAKDPQVAVPKALRSTVYRLIIFYIFTLILMLAIVPWASAGIEKSPFVKVMEAFRIPGAAGIMNFVVLVAALSAMNSQLYITTRMMFSLSRSGYAPKRFGELNKKGVPVYSLVLSTFGIALAATIYALVPDKAYVIMMGISMFGAMFTWFMIFITHYFFRKKYNGKALPVRMIGFPYLTLLGALLMLSLMVTTWFVEFFKMTLMVGIPWLILLCIAYRLHQKKAKASAFVPHEQDSSLT
ncbi:amino acid permease [Ectobacillus sp. JY-23]|uniref:amino acid permease n=1 Tax=Ectobacillus sp. JY-23 TaxID=2933872 RepID=UPI001FF2133F|nr:amino acid permease [Ectobacillus sp. JY-23]UOY92295.1 amino acid permease [Ectobacillus sp. JY-23]